MTFNIISHDIASLLDDWIEDERNGVQFPVPFDAAWQMAGYATKASAKRALKDLDEGIEFSTQLLKNARAGRSSESISFSLKGLKEFCLLARTPEGKAMMMSDGSSDRKGCWRLSDGCQVRECSIRALARFQTFPDGLILSDRNSLDCKGIGNAVPPLALERILSECFS